jgi:chromosome segregation ATPase
MLTTTSIPDEQFKTEENDTFKRDNERLASQVIQLKLELSTLSSEHGEVRDELISTRCELYAKNRDITKLRKHILDLKNNPTALNFEGVDHFYPANTNSALAQNNLRVPEQEKTSTQTVNNLLPTTVVDNRIEELEDQYKNACAQNSYIYATTDERAARCPYCSSKRKSNASHSARQQSKRTREEEKASPEKKIKELESDHQENVGRIRQYYQTLLNNRNCKNNELEQTISELNSTIDECEENHRTEMEEMNRPTRYSIIIDERNEHWCSWSLGLPS